VAAGFLLLGLALIYSHRLVPNVDFRTLVIIRMAQAAAIGFLFVPVSTLAYISLPQRLNRDATSLFTMFRNIAGSIGIALSTSIITSRTQANMAHMAGNLSPLSQNYMDAVAGAARVLRDYGVAASDAMQGAAGMLYRTLIAQATIIAYLDMFTIYALLAFALLPLAFFFSPVKASGKAGGHG
jgi:DHA2 family multidrug resistance protein